MINLNSNATKFYMIIGILVCMFFSNAYAGQLPSHYPNAYRWVGIVEDISADSIVIGDREFTKSSNISFNRLNSLNTTINEVKIGMIIGCKLSNTDQIISVWEFPNSLSSVIGPWADGVSLN